MKIVISIIFITIILIGGIILYLNQGDLLVEGSHETSEVESSHLRSNETPAKAKPIVTKPVATAAVPESGYRRAISMQSPEEMETFFWEQFEAANGDMDKVGPLMVRFLDSRYTIDSIKKINYKLIEHPNTEIRLRAAHYLFLFEDDAAYPVVIDILKNPPGNTMEEKTKNQQRALDLLVKFKKTQAKDDILEIYRNHPQKDEWIGELAELGYKEIIPDILEYNKNAGLPNIGALMYLNPENHEAIIEDHFNSTTKRLQRKNLSAWGMLKADPNNEFYYNYLKDLADPAAQFWPDHPNRRKGRASNDHTWAFKYLASIKSPQVKEYLEESLDSENPLIVEMAMVNLLMRHGDSPKAVEKLKEVMSDKRSKFKMDTKFRLAFEINDPEVLKIAKETYDGQYQGPSNFWWKYNYHNQYQSVYYWIDNYTIDYIEERDRPKEF